jgi:prophage tail gpP-like protein
MEARVIVSGESIVNWQSYDIRLSLGLIADEFSLSLGPPTRRIWDLCALDAEVQIMLGNSPLIRGYIDDRVRVARRGEKSIQIVGRSKMGRIIDESAPLMRLDGLDLQTFCRRVCDPWFTNIALDGTRNRDLIRGRRSAKARAGAPIFARRNETSLKVEPGETRASVLQRFLRRAKLTAWESGDGRELIVGQPNRQQDPQYRFTLPASADSEFANRGNIISVTYRESVGERYSRIIVVGAGNGDGVNYGRSVTRYRAEADDGPGEDGTGGDFRRRKILIVPHSDLRDLQDAQERADADRDERRSSRLQVDIETYGHSQRLFENAEGALFAPETIAEYYDEELDIEQRLMVAAVQLRGGRGTNGTTTLTLAPEDTIFIA